MSRGARLECASQLIQYIYLGGSWAHAKGGFEGNAEGLEGGA